MLKNLRKKMNSVLPDMETLYLPSPAPSSSMPIPSSNAYRTPSKTDANKRDTFWANSSVINFNAGCSLLERNERTWEGLHATNESNATKAETIDKVIANITDNINKQVIDLSDINVSLEAIPQLVKTIEKCSNVMLIINEGCIEVEKELYELEDLMEVLQLQEKQLDKKFEMALYKERKLANLETVRQSLAVRHADTIKESEKKMRLIQQERQAVFQDAFQNDLNCYKQFGKIPKIDSRTPEPSLTLEEIVLDDVEEKQSLDNFLNEDS